MKLTYGWLPQRSDLGWDFSGIKVSPDTKTRKEEYAFACDSVAEVAAEGGLNILDAAAGWVPGWHMLPYMLANAGHRVHAVDIDFRSLKMPAHPLVKRELADISNLQGCPNKVFDVTLCISAMEHINPVERTAIYKELVRVTKKRVIFTADEATWLPSDLLYLCEQSNIPLQLEREQAEGEMLQPRVMFGVLDLQA